MANSGYYYNLYKQYKDKASSLQKNIDALTKIKNTLSGDFYDEQSAVNTELNDLKEDLNKAVRHDSIWLTTASKCESYKEKASSADSNLDSALDYLEAEISSLRTQKSQAETDSNNAYSRYQTEKANEEREAREAAERAWKEAQEAAKRAANKIFKF